MKSRSLLGLRFCCCGVGGLPGKFAAKGVLVKQIVLFPAPPGPLLLLSVCSHCLAPAQPPSSSVLCALEGRRKAPRGPQRCFFVPFFLRRCFSSGAFLARF